jgi:hypothetical protein
VVVEERNFGELAGEFACDDFRKRHEAGLRVGRHGEAALEGTRAVSSADSGAEHEGVTAVEGDSWLEVDGSWYVVSFVVFHERYFSVPAGRFIRGVLFAYELQLQHLNRTTSSRWLLLKQCARGSLGSVRDWYMFQYFFRFTCLRDGSRAATIGCANLQTKQGRVMTTSQQC